MRPRVAGKLPTRWAREGQTNGVAPILIFEVRERAACVTVRVKVIDLRKVAGALSEPWVARSNPRNV
jgi:hypothetical protein